MLWKKFVLIEGINNGNNCYVEIYLNFINYLLNSFLNDCYHTSVEYNIYTIQDPNRWKFQIFKFQILFITIESNTIMQNRETNFVQTICAKKNQGKRCFIASNFLIFFWK